MKFRLIKMDDPKYLKEKLLRLEVLNKPLGLPPGSELLHVEGESLHFVALEKAKMVGCVLFHPETKESGRLYQLAVSQEYQGRGFSQKMVYALEKELIKRGVREVHLHAAEDSLRFYLSLGFRPSSGENNASHLLTKRLVA